MIDSETVKRICTEYIPRARKPTLKGLSNALTVSTATLYRVRCGYWQQGHKYKPVKPSPNRLIANKDFRIIAETAAKIKAARRRKPIGDDALQYVGSLV